MKLQLLNPKWLHSNVTLTALNCRHISRNSFFGLASYNLKPASSYHVILLSTGRTFISFSYIGSSSLHAFQPQTERSSTVFIALLIFRQCCLPVLGLQDLPVNMKNGIISLLNVKLCQILAILDVNPLVKDSGQFLQHNLTVFPITYLFSFQKYESSKTR